MFTIGRLNTIPMLKLRRVCKATPQFRPNHCRGCQRWSSASHVPQPPEARGTLQTVVGRICWWFGRTQTLQRQAGRCRVVPTTRTRTVRLRISRHVSASSAGNGTLPMRRRRNRTGRRRRIRVSLRHQWGTSGQCRTAVRIPPHCHHPDRRPVVAASARSVRPESHPPQANCHPAPASCRTCPSSHTNGVRDRRARRIRNRP